MESQIELITKAHADDLENEKVNMYSRLDCMIRLSFLMQLRHSLVIQNNPISLFTCALQILKLLTTF